MFLRTRDPVKKELELRQCEELIEAELKDKFSWVGTKKNFMYIKKMFEEGKITFVNLNVLDEDRFRKLSVCIKEFGYDVDTIYTSNIQNWVTGVGCDVQDLDKMFRSIASLVTQPNTLYIDSYSSYDFFSPDRWMDCKVRKAMEVDEIKRGMDSLFGGVGFRGDLSDEPTEFIGRSM